MLARVDKPIKDHRACQTIQIVDPQIYPPDRVRLHPSRGWRPHQGTRSRGPSPVLRHEDLHVVPSRDYGRRSRCPGGTHCGQGRLQAGAVWRGGSQAEAVERRARVGSGDEGMGLTQYQVRVFARMYRRQERTSPCVDRSKACRRLPSEIAEKGLRAFNRRIEH